MSVYGRLSEWKEGRRRYVGKRMDYGRNLFRLGSNRGVCEACNKRKIAIIRNLRDPFVIVGIPSILSTRHLQDFYFIL